MFKKIIIINFVLIFVLINVVANKPVNLETAKKLVINYYEYGEFEQECKEIIDKAIEYLKKNEVDFNDNKAIIFDIDDTILSFYEKIKEEDFCYICAALYFNDIIVHARIPKVKQVKRLYDYCVENSYHIFFLGCKREKHHTSTVNNLNFHGYNVFEEIIIQKVDEFELPIGQYKLTQRKKLISKGFDIVCCVGDQSSDFEGGNIGYMVKIPNYLYTSH